MPERKISGYRLSLVLLLKRNDASVLLLILLDDIPTVVGRTVVNCNHLNIAQRLAEQ